ncbi:MAG: 30S ribosomal protein S3 [Spirochaetaceae bacterium]|jgi:small subunit ribosomal protein S3|nr:30S ribosomal protein S3 [Spirochaetaceae bacterium]
MGQKVNPIGLRLGINKSWRSHWYASPREYADLILEDRKIRHMVETMPECKNADIAEVEIIRHPQRVTVIIHTARPGVIIGVKGSNIEKVSMDIQKSLGKKVQIKIKEIKRAEANAALVAQSMARQLVNRGSFRKTLKQSVGNAIKAGAQGVKIRISGRLGGAEMSRTEEHKEGRVPLHTLRADIDYGFSEAFTTFGKIGVKVWIYNGMMYSAEQNDDAGQVLRKRRDNTAVRNEPEAAPSRAASAVQDAVEPVTAKPEAAPKAAAPEKAVKKSPRPRVSKKAEPAVGVVSHEETAGTEAEQGERS